MPAYNNLLDIYCQDVALFLTETLAKKAFGPVKTFTTILRVVRTDTYLKVFFRQRCIPKKHSDKVLFKHKQPRHSLKVINKMIDEKGLRGAQVYWEMTEGGRQPMGK